MAAGIQAGIGNVAAGGAFAVAQSIAMDGAVPVACTAIGAGIGAVATAIGVGPCTDDENADLVAAWARAEVVAAVARMKSAAYADLAAAWARAEALAAAAWMGSAAVAHAGAGATAGVLAIILVLTAGGVAACKFPSIDLLVIQHPISGSHYFKA